MSVYDLKSDAEALRLGLLLGIVDVRSIVAWADKHVLADRGNTAPVLFDLSLAGRSSEAEVVSLLGEFPGMADPAVIGRRLVTDLATRFAAGQIDVVIAARAMYALMMEGYSPDAAFERAAYAADDGVDMVLSRSYGTLDEVADEVRDALAPYAVPIGSPSPPAV